MLLSVPLYIFMRILADDEQTITVKVDDLDYQIRSESLILLNVQTAGRRFGRLTRSPLQFGQILLISTVQPVQKVHS